MTKNPHIRAVDGDHSVVSSDQNSPADASLMQEEYLSGEEWYEETVPDRSRDWLAPAVALLAIAGWSGFFAWAYRAEMMRGAPAQQWIDWITAWAIPVLLVVAVWLLAMRISRREAGRFSDVANRLANDTAFLEDRLAAANRELSLAREFLTTQTRELEFLGRAAAERLSENAATLQSLIVENSAQVASIADVSVSALENMNRLRDNLPVIANSARDVSNNIGNAGRVAQNQLGELVTGFERLNEFGAASERQVGSLRQRVEETLSSFRMQTEQFGEIAQQRFAVLTECSEKFCNELEVREVEALAAIRARADILRNELAETSDQARASEESALEALLERLSLLRQETSTFRESVRAGEHDAIQRWTGQINELDRRLREILEDLQLLDDRALESSRAKLSSLRAEAESVDTHLAQRNQVFQDELNQRRDAFTEAEAIALQQLEERLAELDKTVAERRAAQLEQMSVLAEQGTALGEKLALLGTQMAEVAEQGSEANGLIAASIDSLNAKLVESREALDGTDMAVAALTDASVRLLELVQATAKHSREDLPVAMQSSEDKLSDIERRAAELRALLDQASQSGETVHASMTSADTRARETMASIDEFQSRFGETARAQVDSIERLRAGVAALRDEGSSTAAQVQAQLHDAVELLETRARSALAAIETDQAERIAGIAAQLGEKSAEAIDRAVSERGEEAIGSLNEATERATEASREAARQLRDQLAKVGELTANLEARILRARERAEEQVDNDFTRRVALITESLNSNAIDLAKALSTEVTDTAWTAYLRGDRGIFARRAVRLLDNSEAREIAELYDADPDFREHVNRYIHDFEAMLRAMLSTRDGNAVSVTLLSSDIGKLYVALAQAIERLRQ